MRIDKFLSECGLASRKEAAKAAKAGGVTVNGAPVKDLSGHIDPERDRVAFLGRSVEYRKFVYILLNKPEGYVSATEDKAHPFVTELLPEEYRRMGLFPVGRLDKDTVGLMILTNDGPSAHRLLSPRHHVEKEYRFTCKVPLAPDAERIYAEGITLADGYECKSARLLADADRMGGRITLTEGKYHQIKRMLGAIDNRILTLERIRFGGISLDKSLERGAWRLLTAEEERALLYGE
ncbi:MAG: rRNA pseudouridine synthase [Clostridia bacterium]|nr:rRNA pseudouridine synthase [Clostridia bacterium]